MPITDQVHECTCSNSTVSRFQADSQASAASAPPCWTATTQAVPGTKFDDVHRYVPNQIPVDVQVGNCYCGPYRAKDPDKNRHRWHLSVEHPQECQRRRECRQIPHEKGHTYFCRLGSQLGVTMVGMGTSTLGPGIGTGIGVL
jgi:hypothetical protein